MRSGEMEFLRTFYETSYCLNSPWFSLLNDRYFLHYQSLYISNWMNKVYLDQEVKMEHMQNECFVEIFTDINLHQHLVGQKNTIRIITELKGRILEKRGKGSLHVLSYY
mmetsp:Transcript_1527/g.1932  ORF Transcript_1527/g.1932 Transcript_1527/m.1932 type:complete len:109 (+) Transcript_1527:589-915(+)